MKYPLSREGEAGAVGTYVKISVVGNHHPFESIMTAEAARKFAVDLESAAARASSEGAQEVVVVS